MFAVVPTNEPSFWLFQCDNYEFDARLNYLNDDYVAEINDDIVKTQHSSVKLSNKLNSDIVILSLSNTIKLISNDLLLIQIHPN